MDDRDGNCQLCGKTCKAIGQQLLPGQLPVFTRDIFDVTAIWCPTCQIAFCGGCLGVSVGSQGGIGPCPQCGGSTTYAKKEQWAAATSLAKATISDGNPIPPMNEQRTAETSSDRSNVEAQIRKFILEAETDPNLRSDDGNLERWRKRVERYLEKQLNRIKAVQFSDATYEYTSRTTGLRLGAGIGCLEAMLLIMSYSASPSAARRQAQVRQFIAEGESNQENLIGDKLAFARWRQRIGTYLEDAFDKTMSIQFIDATDEYQSSPKARLGGGLGVLDSVLDDEEPAAADSGGIEKVMLISVGSVRAVDLKTLTGLADRQLNLGGSLTKFMNDIRSEAEMDQLVNVNHVGEMDRNRLDQELLPHIQGKCPGKRVAATCVQDPINADVAVYCVVIHAS